jgi:ABC-type oligopeptide transport system substrate-binding subunit
MTAATSDATRQVSMPGASPRPPENALQPESSLQAVGCANASDRLKPRLQSEQRFSEQVSMPGASPRPPENALQPESSLQAVGCANASDRLKPRLQSEQRFSEQVSMPGASPRPPENALQPESSLQAVGCANASDRLKPRLQDAQRLSEQLKSWMAAICPDRGREIVPYLARLLALPLDVEAMGQLDALSPRQLKQATFEAVEAVIAAMAQSRPLALVCEDLHWADPTSLELLESLLSLTARVPLLLVCVCRPEPDHGSWRLREVIGGQCAGRHIALTLQPLSPGESEALILNLLGARPPIVPEPRAEIAALPEGMLWRALKPTEGNPFFIEEILRALIGQGALARDEASGGWRARDDAIGLSIPDTVQGVLAARIDHLAEAPRHVLRLASVIGRIFPYRLLAALAGEEPDLDAHLLTLQREELIRERPGAPEREYIFKHELTREVAYHGLLKKDRRVAHRRVGETLERLLGARIEEQLDLLAHHWEQAEDPVKAVEYLLRAGDRDRLAYAHQEAVASYERALAILRSQGDDAGCARTLMRLGLVYSAAFDYRKASEVSREGFAFWRKAMAEPQAAPPLPPQTLRLSWYPCRAVEVLRYHSAGLQLQLFAGLVEETPALEVTPLVAEGWDVSADGKSYTFHLRPDAFWSDGKPVIAADFLHGWLRTLRPGMPDETAMLFDDICGAAAYHRGELTNLDDLGIRPIGPHTLVVELERPAAYFLHILALAAATPMPSHRMKPDGTVGNTAGRWVGNGPFVVEAICPGELLALGRNPSYCGRFTGNVERIEINQQFAANQWDAMLELFRRDQLDVCDTWNFPPEAHAAAHNWHSGNVLTVPLFTAGAFVFDVTQAPFDDIRVRRAYQMGVDVPAISRKFSDGRVTPATGGWIPPGMPGHSPNLAPPFDPVEARRLMTEAGYPDGRGFPVIRSLSEHSPGANHYGGLIREQLRCNLGIHMEPWTVGVVEHDLILATARIPPARMMWLGISAHYPDPDSILRVTGQRLWRMVGRRHADFDRLVEKARSLSDHEARMALYRQADAILVREAYIWPHLYSQTRLLLKPWVKRFPISPLPLSFWKDVVIEPH